MSLPQITGTELWTFDVCPLRHHYRYCAGLHKCGIDLPEKVEKMELGIYVHEILELYVTKGVVPETSGQEYAGNLPGFAAMESSVDPLPFKAANRVLLAYQRKYPMEPKLKAHAHEHKFSFSTVDEQPIGAEMVGKLDLCYEDTDGNLVLRENKYWSPRATIPPLLTMQLTIYAVAVQSMTQLWPSYIEWNILHQPAARRKKGESEEAFLDRVEGEATFQRERIAISPQEILASWRHQVAPKVLLIGGILPYMNTGSCTWHNRPCEYLPLCKAKLEGRDPCDEELAAYRHKEVKHVELK